ncbi:MAG: zinc ribbon domain-containing protein [Bryobacterales bacterium]|nr:zinc ribbon domain-containing protein [Bryobacterales bacterium]
MSLVLAVVAVLAVTLLYTLFVRAKDIPAPDPVSPTRHLDERKAAIYENLRDLQFEYRVGKLSDADYVQTKLALQKELGVVVAEAERVVSGRPAPVAAAAVSAAQAVAAPVAEIAAEIKTACTCPHCGAEFAEAMRFCGACGKEMA